MMNEAGMIEGVTTTPLTTEEDGTTTGDTLIMMTTLIRPAIHTVRPMIVLITAVTPGGRFSLIVNDLGKEAPSLYKRGLQWVCLKR
jgi:hypothetical protein